MNCPCQHRRVSGFKLRPSLGFRGSGFGFQRLLTGLVVTLALRPHWLVACADSAMAKGMNLGILSLLAVVGVVLGGVASFFVYLGKKSATVAAASVAAPPVDSTNRA